MTAAYVRRHYGVPAFRGRRIRYTPWLGGDSRDGTIVGFRDQYLRVRFDDADAGRRGIKTIHPTWAVEYLGPSA